MLRSPDSVIMSEASGSVRVGPEPRLEPPPLLGIFASWRLQAYGYTLAAFYVACLVYVYWLGAWLVNAGGVPLYHDFTNIWVAATEALHGKAAAVYDQAAQMKAQEALVGAGQAVFSTWPYPPIYLLFLAPLGALFYVPAFITWQLATLLGCVAAVYFIVHRREAIALVLASPFTVCNVLTGQSGFVTTALLGGSLLFLERRPVLAGVFIGCLTYKPQFGILLPLALAAANQWRAFVSAAVTALILTGASIAAFGTGPWIAFPEELAAQANGTVFGNATNQWGYFQTVYGLIRYLDGSPTLAWLAQGLATFGTAVIVWFVWRSSVRYALKAATLSAGALIATPYAFGYDLAAIVIPFAFLANDQIDRGLLKGEQTIMLGLFAGSFSVLPAAGRSPIGALITLTLFYLILRRAVGASERAEIVQRSLALLRISDA
jgi:arabinofuranan 3-O-arabinosyltransferase